MKVVEPPPLSDTTCSSSPRPATVSKYQRIKMDFCVPFVLYLYILYFVFLASSLAQLALLRRDRQPSVNINESKIYSCWKKVFAKNKQRQKQNNLTGRFLWHLAAEKKGEARKSQYINRSKIYSHWKRFLQRTMAKPKQSDGKNFVTFGCREKWETRNIFPTNQRTKNS